MTLEHNSRRMVSLSVRGQVSQQKKNRKRPSEPREQKEERLKQRKKNERYNDIEYCLQELRFIRAIKYTLSEELIDKRKSCGGYVV